MPRKREVARYAVTFGLAGCYMPDSHAGVYEWTTRRELAAGIRDLLATYDLPKSLFRDAKVKRVWKFIARWGSSSAHFGLHHGANVLEFHGLTEAEYTQQLAAEDR